MRPADSNPISSLSELYLLDLEICDDHGNVLRGRDAIAYNMLSYDTVSRAESDNDALNDALRTEEKDKKNPGLS